jgi:hypothetical protein
MSGDSRNWRTCHHSSSFSAISSDTVWEMGATGGVEVIDSEAGRGTSSERPWLAVRSKMTKRHKKMILRRAAFRFMKISSSSSSSSDLLKLRINRCRRTTQGSRPISRHWIRDRPYPLSDAKQHLNSTKINFWNLLRVSWSRSKVLHLIINYPSTKSHGSPSQMDSRVVDSRTAQNQFTS